MVNGNDLPSLFRAAIVERVDHSIRVLGSINLLVYIHIYMYIYISIHIYKYGHKAKIEYILFLP
jgi:hypothetical protein